MYFYRKGNFTFQLNIACYATQGITHNLFLKVKSNMLIFYLPAKISQDITFKIQDLETSYLILRLGKILCTRFQYYFAYSII